MNVSFILNGEDVMVQAAPSDRLSTILHEVFHLRGTSGSCHGGHCGLCGVFLQNLLVPSCMVPVFTLEGKEIVTIEGFSQTFEYQDIIQGIEQTGLQLCGYCTNATILSFEDFLIRTPRPSVNQIEKFCTFSLCTCSTPRERQETLLRILEIRQRRMYGRFS